VVVVAVVMIVALLPLHHWFGVPHPVRLFHVYLPRLFHARRPTASMLDFRHCHRVIMRCHLPHPRSQDHPRHLCHIVHAIILFHMHTLNTLMRMHMYPYPYLPITHPAHTTNSNSTPFLIHRTTITIVCNCWKESHHAHHRLSPILHLHLRVHLRHLHIHHRLHHHPFQSRHAV